MSQPHRHNRQDGQIQNLRNFQIFLRVAAGVVVIGALAAATIFAVQHGGNELWRNLSPFLTCCLVPVVCLLVVGGIAAVILNRRAPIDEAWEPDETLSDLEDVEE